MRLVNADMHVDGSGKLDKVKKCLVVIHESDIRLIFG